MSVAIFIRQRQEAIKKAELEIQQIKLMEELFGEYWLGVAFRFSRTRDLSEFGQVLTRMCGLHKNVPSELRWIVTDEEVARCNMSFSQFRENSRLRDATKPINLQETCICLLETIKNTEERQILEENLARIPSVEFSQLNSIYQKYGPQIIAQAIIKVEPFTKYDLLTGFLNLRNWLKNEIDPPDCPYIVEQYFEAKFGIYDVRSIKILGEMVEQFDQELVLYAMSTFSGGGLIFQHIIDVAESYQVHADRVVDSARFIDHGYKYPIKLDSIQDDEIFQLGFDNDTMDEIPTPGCTYEIDQEELSTTVFPPPDNGNLPEEPDWENYRNPVEVQEPNPLRQDEDDEEDDEDEFGPFGRSDDDLMMDEPSPDRYYDYSSFDPDGLDSDELDEYYGGDYYSERLEDEE